MLANYAGGDQAIFNELAAVSGFVAAEQRFLVDSPLIGGATPDFGPLWVQILGRPATAEFFAEIDRLYNVTGLEHLVPIGDPADVLAGLRRGGYRLGIATNDAEAGTHAQIARLGLAHLVEFVAGHDSGFGAKPAAGPVLAFARAVEVAAHEVAMVGDEIHDLAAARAAGAVALGVRSGPVPGELLAPHADALIDSIAELPAWLEQR